jgi:hypothetical protein
MKIVEFFLIIWGEWSESEPEFLTSWSRSRTKMDRLRNTDYYFCHLSRHRSLSGDYGRGKSFNFRFFAKVSAEWPVFVFAKNLDKSSGMTGESFREYSIRKNLGGRPWKI